VLNHVTILSNAAAKPVAKRVFRHADGQISKLGAPMPKYFLIRREPVETIDDLANLLVRLESERDAFVIRGTPIGNFGLNPTRRLKHADGDIQPTFYSSPAGERWLCVDFDKVVAPTHFDVAQQPVLGFLYLRHRLPSEFHRTAFIGQWSASAGMDGWKTISAHLWFMLKEPQTDDVLNQWAKNVPGIDARLYNTVQPHFTCAPAFTGLADPIQNRTLLIDDHEDTVCLNISVRHDFAGISRSPRETQSHTA
jgi:hypothetical protein